jgi:3-mercaptopyruvate sulfurtransferase SseA
MRTLGRALALLALGSALGLCWNGARGARGVALGKRFYSTAEGGACTAPASKSEVGAAEAAGLRGQGGVAFGDTRSPDDYAHGHVTGAWHLPCFGSAAIAAASLTHLTGARTIILYGRDEPQTDALLAAEELSRRGFADVRILRGGWHAWQAAGLPAESGPCDDCRKP